ncbi:MAG: transposase [Chlorobiales bacterium]|nr:transposase [Chlorobiales bacterium]
MTRAGLLDALKKRFIEQALEAEMDEHLGYPKHAPFGAKTGNSRNSSGSKTIIVDIVDRSAFSFDSAFLMTASVKSSLVNWLH